MRRTEIDTDRDDATEPGMALRATASPEPDSTAQMQAAAERRLAKARARRAAQGETIEPVAEVATVSAENTAGDAAESSSDAEPGHNPLPWHGHDATVLPWQAKPDVPDESQWPIDPESGQRMSPKLFRMKTGARNEAELREQNAGVVTSPKQLYLNRVPDDAEFAAAEQTYSAARAYLARLQSERATISDQMTAAITSGNFTELQRLRERAQQLPHEIDVARVGEVDAQIAYKQFSAARLRVGKNEARANAHHEQQEFLDFQKRVQSAQSEASDAENRYADAIADVGAAQRKRDAILAELMSQQAAPQYQRPLMSGSHESGGDVSAIRPMPGSGYYGT